jgi:hypothetical protein
MIEFYENTEWGHGTAPLYGTKLNNKQFGDLYVRHSLELPQNDKYGARLGRHTVTAYDKDHNKIGYLEWHKKTGEILNVDVDKPFRRQGVATSLLRRAQDLSSKYNLQSPLHSKDRSDQGDAWAKSTGDKVPRRIGKFNFPEV